MTKAVKSSQDTVDTKRALSRTIGEVSRLWRYQMNQRLKPFGLNLSMRQVLMQLHRNPAGLMQRDLARKLGIEGATLVRLLDQLEEKKWIQRITASDDKRCKHAVLTSKATEQIRLIEELSSELRNAMMQALSPHDIAMCVRVMQRIKDNLE
ncbi:MAG TPA: MarR family transcriptional regulator [Paucimonas sp.]|nr:MarR family transcriptional regulator [Paucimonas sp.]HJW54639.1 MarR family transcriptional regulator [Burkholderiaceae bacterium]